MTEKVLTIIENKVAIIVISNPPVNSLNLKVRKGLLTAVELADNDNEVLAIVIKGDGKTFPVGADIKEFALPLKAPHLPDICDRIENCSKPVVVALHGTPLGGGFEIALAGHYRIATSNTKVGLPEVHLGLLPGAGGTQRLPRLAGIKASMDIISNGLSIDVSQALKLGVIDALVDDLNKNLCQFVLQVIDSGCVVRRTRDSSEKIQNSIENKTLILEARKKITKNGRSPQTYNKIVDCIEATLNLSFADGLEFESEAFSELRNSDDSKGMIHAFFAERASSKIPEIGRIRPQKLKKMGIIGGGVMGCGITIAAMQTGLEVLMVERDEDSLAKSHKYLRKVFDRDVEKGRLTIDKKEAIMKLYNGSTDYTTLSAVDIVIEAVVEDMEIKKSVFKTLDKAVPKGVVLASNISYLNIDEIAEVTERPQNVIGLHFFSPANLMKLLEIVIPKAASESTIATGFELAKKLGKIPVRVGNCDGFIGNRILSAYANAAAFMMEDGASPYEIDRAVKSFGYPIGLYQMLDFLGGDIGWAARKRQSANRNPNARYVEIADRLCELGWFGKKTGQGFYNYSTRTPHGAEDPKVLKLIQHERDKKNIKSRKFTDVEIIRRYLAAMVNEGANVLYDGFVLRPSDIDVTKLHGYGFPRFRGGPMKYADTYGLKRMLNDLIEFEIEDPIFWKPSPLILELVKSGKNFESLNN